MRTATYIICVGAICLASGYAVRAQDGARDTMPVATPAAVAAAPVAANAQGPVDEVDQWTPVSQDALDETRGGFDLGNGLVASFGIDRAVYVNGNLVTSTSFNVPDIAHITAQQASAMAAALNTISVVQVGPNNTFDATGLQATSAGTVIQNTLNHQNIQSITTLNTTVNSLNAFRQGSLQDALQQSQLQSLGH
ncbi:hypothetical protein DVT68_13440 [Dyella solisilvae]|uniref:Uncharacterized protein n=1 Tax=Dyella solisilvae TaxID=1920168 RepID=A0A370K610_9GAMM|nr:hypothetical protein [Dyella solisilvae]RDI98081.1 hypothetical protein DVT68_13440 [Dyella solisilvae]